MLRMRKFAAGSAMALSLVGTSSASAADWMPLNTLVTEQQEGVARVTVTNGLSISCSTGSGLITAPSTNPAVGVSTAPVFSNCTDPLGQPMTVTSFGTWHYRATSTTGVDITGTPDASGRVATYHFPSLGCDVTVPGPVFITGDWNNTNHTLSVTPSLFQIHSNTEACGTLFGTTAGIDANYVLPSSVTIT